MLSCWHDLLFIFVSYCFTCFCFIRGALPLWFGGLKFSQRLPLCVLCGCGTGRFHEQSQCFPVGMICSFFLSPSVLSASVLSGELYPCGLGD